MPGFPLKKSLSALLWQAIALHYGNGNIPVVQDRTLLNMNFKIAQPVRLCNSIFTELIYIAPDLADRFSREIPPHLSPAAQRVEMTRHHLCCPGRWYENGHLLHHKTNQLDMKGQRLPGTNQLFQPVKPDEHTQGAIEFSGIDYRINMRSDDQGAGPGWFDASRPRTLPMASTRVSSPPASSIPRPGRGPLERLQFHRSVSGNASPH